MHAIVSLVQQNFLFYNADSFVVSFWKQIDKKLIRIQYFWQIRSQQQPWLRSCNNLSCLVFRGASHCTDYTVRRLATYWHAPCEVWLVLCLTCLAGIRPNLPVVQRSGSSAYVVPDGEKTTRYSHVPHFSIWLQSGIRVSHTMRTMFSSLRRF